MRIDEQIVRFAAGSLPRPWRTVRGEEWLADLHGSAELGIRRSNVTIGAILFAVSIATLRRHIADAESRLEKVFTMHEATKAGFRLAGYGILFAFALIGAYISLVQLSLPSSGSGPGFALPGGESVSLVPVMLIVSGLVAVAAAVFGARAALRLGRASDLVE